MKYFVVVSFEMIMRLIFGLPRYRICNSLKSVFIRCLGAKVGKRVTFYPGVWIAPGRNLTIGNDVDLALDVLITSSGGVKIEDRVLIGYRTQILSSNHRIPSADKRIFDSGHLHSSVLIKQDSWIGAGCTILPGVTIGQGVVVAAGSVVTKDIPDFAICAGIPAKIIRMRDFDETSTSEYK